MSHTLSAAVYARVDELVAAEAHDAEALKLDPTLTLKTCSASLDYSDSDLRDHHLQALEMAGMPA